MKTKLQNKLSSRKGMTLVEMLVSVAILALITLVLAGSIDIAMNTRARILAHAESSQMATILARSLTDEMRYGTKATVVGGELLYCSKDYSSGLQNASIEANADGYAAVKVREGSGTKYYELLSSSAYSEGLRVHFSKMALSDDEQVLSMSMTIYDKLKAGGSDFAPGATIPAEAVKLKTKIDVRMVNRQ